MRTPHPEDFDPDYASKITPEDVDFSGIEPIKSHAEVMKEAKKNKSPRSRERTNGGPREPATARTRVRTNQRTVDRANASKGPQTRKKKRRSFNIFVDQYADLKDIVHDETKSGVKTDMGQIVRELLEKYIQTYKQRTRERANG